ncbi:MAG: glucose-6-phosphate isomerase, partial [Pseudomonadota bacterium]
MSDRDRDLAAAAAAHDAATGPAWRALEAMAAELAARPLRTLFAEDPARFERLSARQGGDLLLDFSKERLTPEILAQLVDLAEAAGLPAARARMFAGEIVN